MLPVVHYNRMLEQEKTVVPLRYTEDRARGQQVRNIMQNKQSRNKDTSLHEHKKYLHTVCNDMCILIWREFSFPCTA